MTAQPRRDASAQSIADRTAPFVAAEGFAKEWALFGPTLAQAYVSDRYAEVEEGLRAECAAAIETAGFTTLRCDLATGQADFIRAPKQEENRIVLDASSGDKLKAFRGVVKLFRDIEQQTLASASEVLIVASSPEWVARNKPHPVAPTRLRIVIILPHEDRDDHFNDMHRAVHVAIALARLSAGRATRMWFVSGTDTKIDRGGITKPCPPGVHAILGKNAHESSTAKMFLDVSSRVEIRRLRSGAAKAPFDHAGGFETTIFSSGCAAVYWLGYLSGRGRTFELSGFQRKDLPPAAFARRPMLVFSDSGGFQVEGRRDLPAALAGNSILIWGDDRDDPERLRVAAKEKATLQ